MDNALREVSVNHSNDRSRGESVVKSDRTYLLRFKELNVPKRKRRARRAAGSEPALRPPWVTVDRRKVVTALQSHAKRSGLASGHDLAWSEDLIRADLQAVSLSQTYSPLKYARKVCMGMFIIDLSTVHVRHIPHCLMA
eukprot:scaffold3679_cov44-Prasinocladus_malaysianus.AAC.1